MFRRMLPVLLSVASVFAVTGAMPAGLVAGTGHASIAELAIMLSGTTA